MSPSISLSPSNAAPQPMFPRSQAPRPTHTHSSPALNIISNKSSPAGPAGGATVRRAPSAPAAAVGDRVTGASEKLVSLATRSESSSVEEATEKPSSTSPLAVFDQPLLPSAPIPEPTTGLPKRRPSTSSSHAASRLPSRSHTPAIHNGGETDTADGKPTPQTGASRMAAAAKRGLDGEVGGEEVADIYEEGHPLSEKCLREKDYKSLTVFDHPFHIPNRFNLLRSLGKGAYGLVINVQDTYTDTTLAVKCITRVFDKVILAKRALREITLLRHFWGHENLTGLVDLDHVWDGYNEIYLYMEPMEADLHQIIRSDQTLTPAHSQYFTYQLLRGMAYIHSANVIHRDLKPGNLLVNGDCELKICDFGLARGFRAVDGEEGQEDGKMTEYVATRWYRAPEIMLSNKRYTTAIDVWSIGCIIAELLGRQPIFRGDNYVEQLTLIFQTLGTPDDETLEKLAGEKACAFVRSLPHYEPKDLRERYPGAEDDAIDLTKKLLQFDHHLRPTVADALKHPYVAKYHDPSDEPPCEIFTKWEEVEGLKTIEELREAISREIREIREEVREIVEEEEDGEEEMMEYDDGKVFFETPDMLAAPTLESSDPSDPVTSSTNIITPSTPPTATANANATAPPSQSPKAIPFPVHPRSSSHSASSSRASSAPRTREHSPSTPHTALSEESFGAPYGRVSRRSSTHSLGGGRRPGSLFFHPFGSGMTPMSSIVPSHPSTPSTATAFNQNQEPGTARDTSLESRDRRPSGHWRSRSRAASQVGGSLVLDKLTALDVKDHHDPSKHADGAAGGEGRVGLGIGGDAEVPPMTVSPSDAPPSAPPKAFEMI
ncbi:hypothetical protein B9479_005419 [Cryptococcus floricola]|uniref:Mitogen-activated protein kinase n=1 Tax=Cryptococcus floricola TaxID=2591691 RepID=A0A5D3ASZ7_9TREE|nr:hypothetical protein B9479_005419 [Cryptococcus floricola]